jgi:hypothetical protein
LFFSYIASVILLSLALYGLWHVVRDVWEAYHIHRVNDPMSVSLLLIVRNTEQQIEGMIRYLLQEVAADSFWCELVIVDYASDDITPAILDRLAIDFPQLKVIHLAPAARAVADGMAFCQGEVVYVLDFVNRLRCERFMNTVGRIMQHS